MSNVTIPRPRTSRWRPGRVFEEVWTNAKAAYIGFLIGRGYSSPAVAECLDDGTSDAAVRHMAQKWGLPTWGRKSDGFLVIPMKQRDRATIAARAAQEGLGQEEWCRQLIVAASRQRKTFRDIVNEEQFEA